MSTPSFDVVVVGAGCAGISAAIGLAKAGFQVAVVEAAVYPGAENWSGCVYFCENLADPDLLGPEGVEKLAWERRLVRRGAFVCNGGSLLGVTYTDPEAFRHCYTVLRPIFDHHLAQLAVRQGVVLLNATTAESLLRDGGRVIGIATQRGPLYARLVFLAEGDASHLVTREGYEQLPEGKRQPSFLQGIKQVIDMSPEVVERNFDLRPGEGAAFEVILRNARLNGRQLRLNMGGFVYTNHASLSIGLVLPADHLAEHFAGDPNLLLEWFENLPDLQPWFAGGTRGVFGAKLIRGGGPKEFPRLVDHGLAIGGAASGLGVDFPYPNYTGPATRMGLQLVRAVKAIRRQNGEFTAETLQRYYLEPLKQTRYWRDAEFLRDWPGYVEKTQVFFDRQVDFLLGSAWVWTQEGRKTEERWQDWLYLLLLGAAPEWEKLHQDQQHLAKAMPVGTAFTPPPLPLILHDAWLTTLRSWFGSSNGKASKQPGLMNVHYSVQGRRVTQLPANLSPAARRLLTQLRPGLAGAAQAIYANDDQPLPAKINRALRAILRHLDLGAALRLAWSATRAGWGFRRLWQRLRGLPADRARAILNLPEPLLSSLETAAAVPDLTPLVPQAAQKWEDRLGKLGYVTDKRSHIHLRWPAELGDYQKPIVADGLWHVCPAHVYEARVSPLGQLQVVVNHENCVKCETCWRTTDLVDWGRDGLHRFIYAVHSPAAARLIATQAAPPIKPLQAPKVIDCWDAVRTDLQARLANEANESEANEQMPAGHREAGQHAVALARLARQLERKLAELPEAISREPRTIDMARQDYLQLLAGYAEGLGNALANALTQSGWPTSSRAAWREAGQRLEKLTGEVRQRLRMLGQHVRDQRYAWAGGEARRIRQHELYGVQQVLAALSGGATSDDVAAELMPYLAADEAAQATAALRTSWRQRLDDGWGPYLWRDLDRGRPLTPPQEDLLRSLVRAILDTSETPALGPSARRAALLAELGRRDPSLGYRAALHLLACDIATQFGSEPLRERASAWLKVDNWVAAVWVEDVRLDRDQLFGSAWLVPGADWYLLWIGAELLVYSAAELQAATTPTKGLGLRGAQLQRFEFPGIALPACRHRVDSAAMATFWQTTAAFDLLAVAWGMADHLTERCIAHATSRVQFPGLFHDERSRDTIGKFGAVKKMIAEMAAGRLVIETLLHDRGNALRRFEAAAYLLCSAPGSIGYNAGQIFGGTGYSEDDILSKFYRDAAAWRFLLPLPRSAAADGWSERFAAVLAEAEARGALAEPVRHWRERLAAWRRGPSRTQQAQEAAGRGEAYLYATAALLARCHARLEAGMDCEETLALLDVWLVREQRLLDELQNLREADLAAGVTPADTTAKGFAPVTDYGQFLAGPVKPLRPGEAGDRKAAGYVTGDFLVAPIDVQAPRYVPEMISTDTRLRATDQRFHELITSHFTERQGRKYERFIEANHRPDDADLDYCRRHGFFRLPIPKKLGGEELLKAEYYSLVMQSNQHADATVSLLIQANTSIGTVPILLARDKDLPKALKECAPLAQNTGLHQDVDGQLESLRLKAAVGDATGLQALARKLEEQLQPVLRSATFKGCFSRFSKEWQALAQAAAVGDCKRVQAKAETARPAWRAGCAAVVDLHAELGRRLESCDLALRWIASGQISAFALTEPSAGSDTARVATRARLCQVPVEQDIGGAYRFTPAAGGGWRRVLDSRRLRFDPDGVFYQWADNQASRIRFDEYDYETDDPRRQRYYEANGERIYFTDIALLRERDGRLWYDYWELTGAKMWITNGRMCGIMALYAKTEQGVTGFIVDRHAEGLVVGKDEEKMGQNGSPTNELSLQAVRVPREAVLGLEGRGQVNALETLNVGRAGLSMSSVSQMRSVLEMSTARTVELGQPDWATWRLDRIAAETFTAEAVAFYVIGLFEHQATQSVRIESAAAKMLVGELLHSTIEWGEELFGRPGQTQQYLIEKRKRDARIVNLYEGTNEIQRFLIAKELATEVLPRWRMPPERFRDDPMSQTLQELLAGLRERLQAGVERFGNGYWSNPNLQPLVFHLSEATAWLLAAQTIAGRYQWLAGQGERERLSTGAAAFARAAQEIRTRFRWFDADFALARTGRYPPMIRAADVLFDRSAHQERTLPAPAQQISAPLTVLVVLEPTAAQVPTPMVQDGQLLESYWALTEADQSALEMALQLRDAAPEQVRIVAAVAGGRGLEGLLREVAAFDVETMLLLTPATPLPPSTVAAGLAAALTGRRFDLVLGPASTGDHTEGLVVSLLAAAWSLPEAGPALSVAVSQAAGQVLVRSSDGQPDQLRPMPAAIAVSPGQPLRPFTVSGYLRGLSRPVGLIAWPQQVSVRGARWHPGRSASAGEQSPPARMEPAQAAAWLTQALGVAADVPPLPTGHVEVLDQAGQPDLPAAGAVVVIGTDEEGRLSGSALAAVKAGTVLAQPTQVLLMAPPSRQAVERAAAALAALGISHVDAWVHDLFAAGDRLRAALLAEIWPQGRGHMPSLVIGEKWTETALARLANGVTFLPRIKEVRVGAEGQQLTWAVHGGKLRAQWRRTTNVPNSLWLTVTDDAEVAGENRVALAVERGPRDIPTVRHWRLEVDRLFGRADLARLMAEVKAAAGVARLSDAEFIVDVGAGVGNRDGYEAVIEPLLSALKRIGVRGVQVGGSRKVTEELHLLPVDRQIGQSGVSVNPKILLAIGISGAPQHLQYIGTRATIVSFNKDAEAPIMTLNQRQPRPVVFPVVGDLFVTVPAFTAALLAAEGEPPPTAAPAATGRSDSRTIGLEAAPALAAS